MIICSIISELKMYYINPSTKAVNNRILTQNMVLRFVFFVFHFMSHMSLDSFSSRSEAFWGIPKVLPMRSMALSRMSTYSFTALHLALWSGQIFFWHSVEQNLTAWQRPQFSLPGFVRHWKKVVRLSIATLREKLETFNGNFISY